MSQTSLTPSNENAGLFGKVLTSGFRATFAHRMAMVTADGGRLEFRANERHDMADGPPSVDIEVLAAVRATPGREHPDDTRVLDLTTALLDSDGRLWQRTRTVSIFELWRGLLKHPEFYPFFERPSDHPHFRNAESVTRRLLMEPMETMCDMREYHLIEE